MPAARAADEAPSPPLLKAGTTIFVVGTLNRDVPRGGTPPHFVEVRIPGLDGLPERRIAVPFESIALP